MGSISNQVNQIFLSRYGVELNPPQGNPQESAPGSGTEVNPNENRSDLRSQPPRAAQAELSRLMLNISRETYSATAVDGLLNPQGGDDSPSLKKADRRALRQLADNAAQAFAAIGKLTVQDILNVSEGSATEELFETAADLQLQLGNKLRELSASKAYKKDEFGEFRNMLDDVSFKCDSRGSEIMTLYCEIRDFGEKLKASQVGDNAKFHGAKVEELVKGMAGSMHGNDKSQLFKTRIDFIEGRLAQFSAKTVIDLDEVNRLLADTDGLRSELMKPEVTQSMDKDIHAVLTQHLGSLRTKLKGYVDRALESAEKGLLRRLGEMNQLGKEITEFIKSKQDEFPCLYVLTSSLSQLESEGLEDVGILDKIQECLSEDSSLRAEIIKYRELPSKPKLAGSIDDDSQVGSFLGQIGYPNLRNVLDMVQRTAAELVGRRISWGGGEADNIGKLSGEDVVNVFRRDDSVSMVIEARIHGAVEDDINPQLCDRNLVKKERLGSGAVNTVYKLTYKMSDGSLKDYVFKPDMSGRKGLHSIVPGHYSYADTQQAVKLNTATCDVADFLGLGGLTGKNHATVHDGQYGLLMEMAPGSTAKKVLVDTSNANLSRFESTAVVGKLAKELNDLRWLDIATGQGDRHGGNYLVDFGEDGMTPKVSAIDNDVSFMPYLVGVGKYRVNHDDKRFAEFEKKLRHFCELAHEDFNALLAKIAGKEYVVDVNTATKAEICALRFAFGFQAFSIPQQMSRSLCERLKSLDKNQLDELAEKLAKNVDNKDGVAATRQRLEEMKVIAARYEREGKIVEDDHWGEKAVKKELECPALLKNQDSNESVDYIVDYQMSSSLLRDFGDLIPDAWKN